MSTQNLQLAPVPPAAPPSPKPPKPTQAKRAPLLVETLYAASVVLTLVSGLVVAGLSLLAGVELWWAALRAALIVAVLGATLWVVNYRLMHGALQAAVEDLRQKQQAKAAAQPAEGETLGLEWKA